MPVVEEDSVVCAFTVLCVVVRADLVCYEGRPRDIHGGRLDERMELEPRGLV